MGRTDLSEYLVSFMEKLTCVEILWTVMSLLRESMRGMDTGSQENRMKDIALVSHLYLRSW